MRRRRTARDGFQNSGPPLSAAGPRTGDRQRKQFSLPLVGDLVQSLKDKNLFVRPFQNVKFGGTAVDSLSS